MESGDRRDGAARRAWLATAAGALGGMAARGVVAGLGSAMTTGGAGAALTAGGLAGLGLGGCATTGTTGDAGVTPDAAAIDPALQAAIDSPLRTPANRARDGARHPAQTLAFFGLRADQTVVELWPGGGMWWTEILAPWLAPRGRYIAALPPAEFPGENFARARPAFEAKLAADPARFGRVELAQFDALDPAFVAPGSADAVLSFRNLHNWIVAGRGESALRAIAAALRPGGVFGIEDHRAAPGASAEAALAAGYVREADVIALAEAAGLRLAARSEINANPRDGKDHPAGVWTLPPTFRLGETDRAKYAAIGESDRFTLRFVKA
ncbi:class I SAM-dependent methyltransferase [Derxia gummosa]|uniref:Class I SAM-dependent methyltransferase n=1 Tax=Derxia gummosa DSM 723 TaxID=1121388 RepID=A0A9U5CVH1_9BURK|nr:class I SAM-dependent methyltransferase [Derxia gummosa]